MKRANLLQQRQHVAQIVLLDDLAVRAQSERREAVDLDLLAGGLDAVEVARVFASEDPAKHRLVPVAHDLLRRELRPAEGAVEAADEGLEPLLVGRQAHGGQARVADVLRVEAEERLEVPLVQIAKAVTNELFRHRVGHVSPP